MKEFRFSESSVGEVSSNQYPQLSEVHFRLRVDRSLTRGTGYQSYQTQAKHNGEHQTKPGELERRKE